MKILMSLITHYNQHVPMILWFYDTVTEFLFIICVVYLQFNLSLFLKTELIIFHKTADTLICVHLRSGGQN